MNSNLLYDFSNEIQILKRFLVELGTQNLQKFKKIEKERKKTPNFDF